MACGSQGWNGPVFTDTHCHLDFPQFDADRSEVWERAQRAGVGRLINPGADLVSSRRAVALARELVGVYAAVGIHPHDAAQATDEALEELRKLAAEPGVVAIGEIGLDYYRDLSPRERQREAFEAQLALASELGLPVIIHCRDAWEDVMRILQSWASACQGRRAVLHAFSGDEAVLSEALRMGFFISIGGPVTFRNARRLPALVPQIPLERLLLETDAPYLAPHPYRGRRNEPAHIPLIAGRVAELHGVSVEVVEQRTTEAAARVFGLSA